MKLQRNQPASLDAAVIVTPPPKSTALRVMSTAIAIFIPFHPAHRSDSLGWEWISRLFSTISLVLTVYLVIVSTGAHSSIQAYLAPDPAQIQAERDFKRQLKLDEYDFKIRMAQIQAGAVVGVADAEARSQAASNAWIDGAGAGAAAIVVLIIFLLVVFAIRV